MLRRLAPAALAAAALLADLGGAHGFAFYAILVAVPAGAAASLAAFGDLVEARAGCAPDGIRAFRAGFSTFALALTVFAGMLHASAAGGGGIPRIAFSALVGALAGNALAAALAFAPAAGREPAEPAPAELLELEAA